ncbi:hypothetical protein [Pararhizobium sp.]|uniref:hypothetical protein n=1 Tax=Pararhizobium sp. TaxID=1977563 RepID=UPI00272371DF|nr:hypothetical protein [Pararhizobium sp.]MDO9417182.1 hypothetical protein [Pararhizobium sp.]
MFAPLRFACALLMLITMAACAPAPPERQTLPGTSWSLVPPAGFALIETPITAFLHPSEAFLMVIDLPLKKLDMAEMAKQGTISGKGNNAMRVDEVREMEVGGRRTFLLRGFAINRQMDMYTLQIEGETTIGMIIGAVPVGSPVPIADMETAVLSAQETPKTIEEPTASLPYRLETLDGMRVALILAGIAAIITEGPVVDIDEADKQPFASVFTFPYEKSGPVTLDDAADVKQRILKQTETAKILETKLLNSPRGKVLEVTYSYTHKKGTPLTGAAWLRADGNSKSVFVITHYPVGTDYYDRLARIRDGVTLK